ncbi:MAG: hypothetical protein AMXMBFR79_05930 [Chitinophagaceae bacterium]
MNTATENILNVTLLEPRVKHPTIFAKFDELNEGETLIIHNDHDPKPLYYQLLGQRGNIFTWDYLESGPEWWKIKISKRILSENNETLGEIVANDFRTAEIFKKYELDFCCDGKKTVREACADKGVDYKLVEEDLQHVDTVVASRPLPYNEWGLDFLADYIVNTHHTYVRKTVPDLRKYAAKVAQVHGGNHPELLEIYAIVEEVGTELLNHAVKEERVVFPYIKEIYATKINGTPLQQNASLGSVRGPINLMEMEHEVVGRSVDKIREISNNYALPEDACASYSLLYKMLEEFEDDLHVHVHLENNILFPKALEIEKQLN